MSRASFEYFGQLAQELNDPFLASGREETDRAAIPRIIDDVKRKLDLQVSDKLLEIGCGSGSLLRPIWSSMALELIGFYDACVTGIDHENFASWFPDSIEFIPGNFLDLELEGREFDKILIYSVLHYLSNMREVVKFTNKALDLLAPWGLMLLGDLPNVDMKKRFLRTARGQAMEESRGVSPSWVEDEKLVEFDDSRILALVQIFKAGGHNCWVLRQPPDLSCGYTREDVLVQKLE